ncbi:MAG TPA: hypothetical protein VGC67_12100 [Cellulomonas sp.]
MGDGQVMVRGTLREYVAALEQDRLETLPALDEDRLRAALSDGGRAWWPRDGGPAAEVMVFGGLFAFDARGNERPLPAEGAAWHAYCIRDRAGVLRALDGDSYPDVQPVPFEQEHFTETITDLARALGARLWVDTALRWDPADGGDEPPGVELTDPEQAERWSRLSDRPAS